MFPSKIVSHFFQKSFWVVGLFCVGLTCSQTSNAAAVIPSVCAQGFAMDFSGTVNTPHNYSCTGVAAQTMLGFRCIGFACMNFEITFLMRARMQSIKGARVVSAQAYTLDRTCSFNPTSTDWTDWCNLHTYKGTLVLVGVTVPEN